MSRWEVGGTDAPRVAPGDASSREGSAERDVPGSGDEPWIETAAGGLFFANAVLVAPAAVVLFPLMLGLALRAVGLVEGPSRMLDTVPRLADHFVPRLGWLAAPAAWVAWKGWTAIQRTGPRLAVAVFLAIHVATAAYTVWRWVTA